MRSWMIPIAGLILLAACGETTEQRATTGAVGGGAAGAVVGGPVGAVVGAGVGAVAGANREKIDEGTDKAADATKEKVAEATNSGSDGQMTRMRSADRVAMAGPTNAEVKEAQTVLQNIGLYDGKIDGIYGSKTIRAVSDFQAQNNLPRTGTLTHETQQALTQQAANTGTTERQSRGQGTPSTAGQPNRKSAMPSMQNQGGTSTGSPPATQNQ